MLSKDEISGYQAFGYVVMKACLTSVETAELEAAYERVMVDAPLSFFLGLRILSVMAFVTPRRSTPKCP